MGLRERIERGEDARPVSRETVVRDWLGREAADEEREAVLGVDDVDRLVAALSERLPVAALVFETGHVDWYRTTLREDELRRSRVVQGPPDEDWRALTDDDTVESVAELVHGADDVAALDDRTPKDLREVVAMAEDLPSPDLMEDLILVQDPGEDAPYVADGNHRAVAEVLHVLRGNEYTSPAAYVGVKRVDETS